MHLLQPEIDVALALSDELHMAHLVGGHFFGDF
jgi:hypothetical protein